MDMTAEEFLNKKYNGKGYSAKVHDWNKSTHHNIVLPNLLEEFASLKTKELEKQLQKEAMNQLSLLDQIKELEEENVKLKSKNGILQRLAIRRLKTMTEWIKKYNIAEIESGIDRN